MKLDVLTIVAFAGSLATGLSACGKKEETIPATTDALAAAPMAPGDSMMATKPPADGAMAAAPPAMDSGPSAPPSK